MMSRKPTRDAIARKLQRLGIPLGYNEAETPPPVLIRQLGGMLVNSAYSLPCGATAVMLNICITNDLPNFAISRFELGLPWFVPNFWWLDDPEDSSSARVSEYCFPGTKDCFSRDNVLNHRADICKNLRRGHSIEGFLLGFGHKKIPPELYGAVVPAFLTVVDQFAQSYSEEIDLWIQRPDAYAVANRSKSMRKPIFEDPDPVPARERKD
jgi:hypothetical protein